jgi:PAS domain S-box-containing protein
MYLIEKIKQFKVLGILIGGFLLAIGIFIVPPTLLAMIWILFIFSIYRYVVQLEQKYQSAQTSADFFHAIIDHTPLLIFWKNPQSIYQGCNNAFAQWVGLNSQESIKGKTDFDFFQDSQAAHFRDIDQDVIKTGQPEERLVDRPIFNDGKHWWRQTLKIPLYDKQHKIISVVGYSEDITHRHELETKQFAHQQILENNVEERTRELREQETFLRSLLDNIPLLVFWKNTQLQFLGCNLPFACTVGKQSPQQLVGFSTKDLAWREDSQAIEDIERAVLNEDIPDYHRIESYLRLDGKQGWLNTTRLPLRNIEGKVIGVLGCCEEITERKIAEDKLKLAHERFVTVLDSIDSFIYVVDIYNHKILFANRSAKMILNSESLVGQICWKTIFPGQEHPCSFCEMLETPNPNQRLQYREYFHAQSKRWLYFQERTIIWDEKKIAKLAVVSDISAFKNTEALLQEHKTRLLETQRIAQLGQWEWILEEQDIELSAEVFRTFGISPTPTQRISVDRFNQAIHPHDRALLMVVLQQTINSGKSFDLEFRVKHPNGSVHYVQSFGSTRVNNYGKVTHIFGTMQDISQRKQAELAVVESERRFRLMADSAPVMIWVSDTIGRATYFNKTWIEFTGTPLEEQLGSGWKRYLHPDDLESYVETYKNAAVEHKTFSVECRARRYDGEYRWILDKGVARYRDDNQFDGYIGSSWDITEQKNAWDALRASESRLKAIFEYASIGILTVNKEGFILKVNRYYLEMSGCNAEKIKHKNYLEFPFEQIKQIQNFHAELSQGKIKSYRLESKLLSKHRKTLWVDISATALLYNGEEHLIIIVTDITEHKQAESVLKMAKELAERTNRAKSTFIASISHELRTPLNGILGYAQILLSDDEHLTLEQRNGIQIIQRSGEHLLMLINDVLDLSKIEANKLELVLTSFNFLTFLDSITDLFKMRAESKGLKLKFEALTPLPQIVKADEKRLRQILLNLLSNAIKFTTEGEVSLQVSYQNDWATFNVLDTGCGILENQLELIFEPFLQVGNPHQKAEGTGLGLPISKNLVSLMKGELKVKSIPQQGSQFYFEIPLLSVNQTLVSISDNNLQVPFEKEVTQFSAVEFDLLVAPTLEDIKQLLILVKKGKVKQLIEFVDNLSSQDANLIPFAEKVKFLADNFQLAKLKNLLNLYNK